MKYITGCELQFVALIQYVMIGRSFKTNIVVACEKNLENYALQCYTRNAPEHVLLTKIYFFSRQECRGTDNS